MNEDSHHHLLDLIYESVLDPARWVQAIEGIADAVGGHSGWLSQISAADGRGEGLIARIDPVMPERYQNYYAGLSPFANHPNPRGYVARWRPVVKTDQHWVDKDVLTRTEFYNDFMRPQKVHNVLIAGLAVRDMQTSAINIHRSESQAPFEADQIRYVEGLHPHLIRAFSLSRVFADLKATAAAAAAALDHSAHGLFILDASGKIQRLNRLAERMIARRDGLTVTGGRLTALQADGARMLQALIGAAGSPDAAVRRGGSMALLSALSWSPVSITVAPIQADRWPGGAGGPAVLVCATDPRTELAIPDQTLRDLFTLTLAEIRVVRALLDGDNPRQAAARFGVGVSTVRSQLASIFEKTGTTGQADLSRLMTRIASGPLD